jgi:DNA-binding GntR family transcriptional regulator
LSARAYSEIRDKIIRLELAPGDVVREDALQDQLGIGRTPIREALQRLARDQFVSVIPRRGMLVTSIDVSELPLLFETRAMMEPYAGRLACTRGTADDWDEMERVLAESPGADGNADLLDVDRRCHEIIWRAAGNRFLTDTLDVLYAQSDRVWHIYLSDVADMRHAVGEHVDILEVLRSGDADASAEAIESHVREFDQQVRAAVTSRLSSPLAV